MHGGFRSPTPNHFALRTARASPPVPHFRYPGRAAAHVSPVVHVRPEDVQRERLRPLISSPRVDSLSSAIRPSSVLLSDEVAARSPSQPGNTGGD
ncbi:hypothetical protein DPEC_G00314810 [Dallia pectoralis]|uniref:Uncharacterized protein n=1 Tax=Dallia pectoralis TaxID=75939 RepID=A0ACC2FCI3_DALPE|nr:hypothetical protein DPEC_G00314810 [Dallia pectoralis]